RSVKRYLPDNGRFSKVSLTTKCCGFSQSSVESCQYALTFLVVCGLISIGTVACATVPQVIPQSPSSHRPTGSPGKRRFCGCWGGSSSLNRCRWPYPLGQRGLR